MTMAERAGRQQLRHKSHNALEAGKVHRTVLQRKPKM
jgi:hypothetical protein